MADYIKRSGAMTICEGYSQHCFETSDSRGQDIADRILYDIAEMNIADVVEVVRCKDCKYNQPTLYEGKSACIRQCAYKKPMDFCSYGERK